jgi:ankyrin repeat protein
LIRIGEYEVSAYIIKDLWALTNFGFNELHYLALCPPNTGKPLSEFKSVSVVKKAQNNKNVTPLHFACINPHPEILKQLLNINSDINI